MPIYARKVRYRSFDRLRHSDNFKDFLAEQADRLSDPLAEPVVVVTEEDIFAAMKSGKSARQIETTATAEDL